MTVSFVSEWLSTSDGLFRCASCAGEPFSEAEDTENESFFAGSLQAAAVFLIREFRIPSATVHTMIHRGVYIGLSFPVC